MAHSDDKFAVIEQYLSTRRRIREIERNALAKIGTLVTGGNLCSFCGNTEEEVRILIQGIGEARICTACIKLVQSMLNGASRE